jgi:class 3 adenylate cyclase/tetratricopeptide (TPR) repeat protein
MAWLFRGRRAATADAPRAGGARLVCPSCGAVNPPGARFCNQCGQRLSDAAPALTDARAEERRVVTILFADLVNSTLLGDALDAEDLRALLARYFSEMARAIHQHGGVVEKFIGDAVMGIFGLPQAHEDDPVRAVRAAIDMQAALAQLNAERLAQDASAPELRMRTGINTGEVVATAGPAEGGDFLVTGDAVNVASRLQSVAEPDAIVVGPRTFRTTQSAVRYRALPPATLRGKPRPVRIWQVLSMADENPVPLARTRSLETPRTSLVGRDVELDLMRGMYDRVMRERRPHLVTILGAPGVGKTRLAREFIAQLGHDDPAPMALVGRCALYGEGITFWPIMEMLRDLCGITVTTSPEEARDLIAAQVAEIWQRSDRDDDPVTVVRALDYILGIETPAEREELPASPQSLRTQIFRSWLSLCEAIATPEPLILLFEDVHWADDTLLDLIEATDSRATRAPVLVICTARPELLQRRPGWGGGRRNDVTLAIEPLSPEQSASLLDELLGGDDLPQALRRNILKRSEGNPFFLEEIVRMLMDREVLVHIDGRWQVSASWRDSEEALDPVIPDTVQAVLAARIDRLAPLEREVLTHAAVIGRSFWPGALAGIMPELSRPQIVAILRDLQEKDLIVLAASASDGANTVADGEPRYLFRHVLTRDVAYDLIPRARRAHDHERFAEWLETFAAGRTEEFADLLARHYEEYYRQAGLARSNNRERRRTILAKAVRWLQISGDRVRRRSATTTAIRAYSRAIELLREASDDRDPADRQMLVDLLAARGDTRALQSDGDGAWKDYRAAYQTWRRAPDGQLRAPDDLARESDEERATGMRLLRRLVTLPARFSSWFRKIPPHDELIAYLETGLRLADEAGDGDTLDRAALLASKTFFWWSSPQGRGREQIADALASAEEAVAIAESHDAPRIASEALDALGNMQMTVSDLCGNLASQTRRLYWGQRIDDRSEQIDIHNEVSAAHQAVGEYARAVEHARTALALAEQQENDVLRAHALQRLVTAYYEWDRFEEAISDGEQLLAIGPATPMIMQNHYRWGVLALAVALARMGRSERAGQVMRQFDDLPAIPETQYVAVFRARLYIARGKLSDAEALLRDALDIGAGRHIFPALLAELAELGARQGRRDLTEAFGARAIDLSERACARKPQAVAIRARGLVALTDGRFDDAARDLDDALARFETLETRWEEARTLYVRAELWRRREDFDAADQDLTAALHRFEQVGAVRDIARARAARAGGNIHLP